jgi:hypothetical protein
MTKTIMTKTISAHHQVSHTVSNTSAINLVHSPDFDAMQKVGELSLSNYGGVLGDINSPHSTLMLHWWPARVYTPVISLMSSHLSLVLESFRRSYANTAFVSIRILTYGSV